MTGLEQNASNPAMTGLDDIGGKYLTFQLADESYGLEILRIREIIGMMQITPIPRTPEFVLGVINLRGKVIPVVDLRSKFGLPYREPDERTCIIVLEAHQAAESLLMGIVVDQVNEVSDVKTENVEATPSFGVSLDTAYISGMAKLPEGVGILLDIDKVLTDSEISSLAGL
jgi:purine-binding chemotaxis protein CheW